jgi:predicted DNA-binding transcriptional regulator AlpA
MKQYSSREAAKKIGLHLGTLQRFIAEGKTPAPPLLKIGSNKLRIWTDEDIKRVREILLKVANGRKTRYQKLREKRQKTQPRAAALPKKRKTKKKKK